MPRSASTPAAIVIREPQATYGFAAHLKRCGRKATQKTRIRHQHRLAPADGQATLRRLIRATRATRRYVEREMQRWNPVARMIVGVSQLRQTIELLRFGRRPLIDARI